MACLSENACETHDVVEKGAVVWGKKKEGGQTRKPPLNSQGQTFRQTTRESPEVLWVISGDLLTSALAHTHIITCHLTH